MEVSINHDLKFIDFDQPLGLGLQTCQVQSVVSQMPDQSGIELSTIRFQPSGMLSPDKSTSAPYQPAYLFDQGNEFISPEYPYAQRNTQSTTPAHNVQFSTPQPQLIEKESPNSDVELTQSALSYRSPSAEHTSSSLTPQSNDQVEHSPPDYAEVGGIPAIQTTAPYTALAPLWPKTDSTLNGIIGNAPILYPARGKGAPRVGQACNRCRAKRIKCSGQQPICYGCSVAKVDCTYRKIRRAKTAFELAFGNMKNNVERIDSTFADFRSIFRGCVEGLKSTVKDLEARVAMLETAVRERDGRIAVLKSRVNQLESLKME